MFRFTELLLTEDGSQVEKKYPVLMQATHICCEQRESFYLIYFGGFDDKWYVIPVKDKHLFELIYKYIEVNDDKYFNALNLYAYDEYETDEEEWVNYENREKLLIDSCLKNNDISLTVIGSGYDSSLFDKAYKGMETKDEEVLKDLDTHYELGEK